MREWVCVHRSERGAQGGQEGDWKQKLKAGLFWLLSFVWAFSLLEKKTLPVDYFNI